MTKIKIFSSIPHGACSFYRSAPMLLLHKIDNVIYNSSFEDKIEWNYMVGTDCSFFERPEGMEIVTAMKKIKSMNIPIWSDYDDDMFNIPNYNPSYEHYLQKDIRESIIQCISLSDVVTVTTKSLRQKFLKYNPSVFVIENAFNDYNYKLNKNNSDEKIINWRGSETHRRDILSYDLAMVAINKDYPEWMWTFIGKNLNFITDKLRYVSHIDELPVSKYWEFISNISTAIQIVPLQFNKFNESKSNISWIEGVYTGACCLAPNMPEWNRPGILTYNNEEEFYWHLRQLIIDEDLRKENFNISREYIQKNLLLSNINKKRIQILNFLISNK
jgi:hypothetical protein